MELADHRAAAVIHRSNTGSASAVNFGASSLEFGPHRRRGPRNPHPRRKVAFRQKGAEHGSILGAILPVANDGDGVSFADLPAGFARPNLACGMGSR